MNIIFVILLVVAILIGFLLFLALVTPGSYTIQREITINRGREEVFDFVKKLKNQEQYSYWVMHDTTNKIDYFGNDGKVGFIKQVGRAKNSWERCTGNYINKRRVQHPSGGEV